MEIEWWMIENFGDGVKENRAERERKKRGVGFWCEEVVSAIICFGLVFVVSFLSCLNWLML